MSEDRETGERLVRFLDETTVGNLRTVVQYDDEGYDYLYGREDARRLDSDEETAAFIDDLREEEVHEREREEMYNIGHHHCTVRVYDRAVLLHFPQGDEVGTVVTLDPEAASELNRFIALCLRELAGTGQGIEHAPEWV